MKTEVKPTWKRLALLAVSALPLALFGTGCSPECTDVYDCRNAKGTPPAGQDYACRQERCELIPVVGASVDAGTGTGTDGGDTTSGDAGSNTGTDAGGNTGTDAGGNTGTDAGDTGTDAGTSSDAGSNTGTDAGTEPPTDGGTDAGVSCADLPHDAKLGTLTLEAGFEAPESAELPAGITAVTALPKGDTFALYGLKSADKSLYALGTWPTLSLGAAPLANVVAPEDRSLTVFLGGYLVNDGTRLLSGYTKQGKNFPGSVLVFDTSNADSASNTRYVAAPGNYSAVGLSNSFLVNGFGLDTLADGAAVYSLRTDVTSASASKLATFSPDWAASSGPSAVTADGIAVLGYFSGNDFNNHLRAVAPAAYAAALTGGAAVDLSKTAEIYAGSDLFAVAGFGGGVALHRGTYDSTTWAAVTSDVSRVALSVSGQDSMSVTAGTLASVLVAKDRCTDVVLLSSMGSDLLVGVTDKNGRRLVRVHKP